MTIYIQRHLAKDLVYLSFLFVVAGFFGSLYFSEVRGLAPCILCWYQRCALYPLMIIIPIAWWCKDRALPYYILGLSLTGLCIALYHNLLSWHVIPERLAPCVQGISCTTQVVSWFGFITIPLLAMASFFGLVLCAYGMIVLGKKYQSTFF